MFERRKRTLAHASWTLAAVAFLAVAASASAQFDGSLDVSPQEAAIDFAGRDLNVALPAGEEAPAPAEDVAAGKNLLQILYAGGPLMIPICFCSFLLCVFVFERLVSLRRGRVIPGPFVKRFLEQLREGHLDQDSAIELCENNKSPISSVFSAALRKWGKPAVEVEQAILDEGERVANVLRRYLRLFNGISTLCPLLGLLGTVSGMIQTFDSIASASAMGRPEALAGGISEALLTTAAGLVVAIPALIAYLYFVGKVDGLVMELDALGQELVGVIAVDGWDKSSTDKSAGEKSRKRTKAAA